MTVTVEHDMITFDQRLPFAFYAIAFSAHVTARVEVQSHTYNINPSLGHLQIILFYLKLGFHSEVSVREQF